MGQVGTISLTKADRFAATRDISGEIVTEKGTNKSRTLPGLSLYKAITSHAAQCREPDTI